MVSFALGPICNAGEVHVHVLERLRSEDLLVEIEHLVPLLRSVHPPVRSRMQVCGIHAGVEAKLPADLEDLFQRSELRRFAHRLESEVYRGEERVPAPEDVFNGSTDVVEDLPRVHAEVESGVDAHGTRTGDLGHGEGVEDPLLAREELCRFRTVQVDVVGSVDGQGDIELLRRASDLLHPLYTLRHALHPLDLHSGDSELVCALEPPDRPPGRRSGEW